MPTAQSVIWLLNSVLKSIVIAILEDVQRTGLWETITNGRFARSGDCFVKNDIVRLVHSLCSRPLEILSNNKAVAKLGKQA